MANKVLGMHRLKNKVNRNAFDLSHRHMFTAQNSAKETEKVQNSTGYFHEYE